jgi:quinol monooxygenase YgiN
MAEPQNKVKLEGYMDVTSDRIAEVSKAVVDHINLTRAESGCISFEVTPCPDVEGRFLVAEVFENRAAFDHHQFRTGQSIWAEITAGLPREYIITEIDE